jgi:hypothetical protein
LFYLDLLLRGEDVDEPEGSDRGRVNGGQQEVCREPLHILSAHPLAAQRDSGLSVRPDAIPGRRQRRRGRNGLGLKELPIVSIWICVCIS